MKGDEPEPLGLVQGRWSGSLDREGVLVSVCLFLGLLVWVAVGQDDDAICWSMSRAGRATGKAQCGRAR